MNYKKPKLNTLTPSRKKLVKSVARGSRYSLAVQAWEDKKINQYILKLISITLRREINTMCSDQTNSLLMGQTPECLKNFTWKKFELELDKYAPTLSCLFRSCFATKAPRQNRTYMLCTCASLMLRNRHPTMSLLQKLISVILYSGHCPKQVIILNFTVC